MTWLPELGIWHEMWILLLCLAVVILRLAVAMLRENYSGVKLRVLSRLSCLECLWLVISVVVSFGARQCLRALCGVLRKCLCAIGVLTIVLYVHLRHRLVMNLIGLDSLVVVFIWGRVSNSISVKVDSTVPFIMAAELFSVVCYVGVLD